MSKFIWNGAYALVCAAMINVIHMVTFIWFKYLTGMYLPRFETALFILTFLGIWVILNQMDIWKTVRKTKYFFDRLL